MSIPLPHSDFRLRLGKFSHVVAIPLATLIPQPLESAFHKLYSTIENQINGTSDFLLGQIISLFYTTTVGFSLRDRFNVLQKLLNDPTLFEQVPEHILKCTAVYYRFNVPTFVTLEDSVSVMRANIRLFISQTQQNNTSFSGISRQPSVPQEPLAATSSTVTQPIPVQASKTLSVLNAKLPVEHDPETVATFEELVYMFHKGLNMSRDEVFSDVITPQVAFVVQELSKHATSCRRGSLDLRLLVLAVVRHTLYVPENERKSFLESIFSFASKVTPPPPETILEFAAKVKFEKHLPGTKKAQLKNLKRVIALIFCALRMESRDVPDALQRLRASERSWKIRKECAAARSFIVPIVGMVKLSESWFQPEETERKRQREDQDFRPQKRSKTLESH